MKRSKFSLSHYKLTTFKAGMLIPCGLVEVLPGDTIQHSTSVLLRLSPLMSPVMHPVEVRVHHWFIPHRLTMAVFSRSWEDFITGGPDNNSNVDIPTRTTSVSAGSLCNHLGLPVSGGTNLTHSSLPLAAYHMVWNEFYRDQDLETSASGQYGSNTLRRISWQKDYFTSSRPWPQKGPDVTLPLLGEAPVKGLGTQNYLTDAQIFSSNVGLMNNDYEVTSDQPVGKWQNIQNGNFASGAGALTVEMKQVSPDNNIPNIRADLTDASLVGVLDLRRAFALQRYAEARARYGSRYVEYLRYLGVRSSDARLQRPEYLGGGRQVISFSEVLQTGPETDSAETPVGTMRGHGIAALRSRSYRKFFEEHGYVLSVISVRPRSMYANATSRHWLKRTKEDYWQKELEHIGQQEIWAGETYPTVAQDAYDTFGYQDRYAEYRHEYSSIAGQFATLYKDWHFARDFSTAPTLNASFVQCNPRVDAFADQTNDQFLAMIQHRIRARRLVSGNASGRIL